MRAERPVLSSRAGAVWMEQAVNHKRYVNQWATAVVLATLTAMFVVVSLLPLVGMWYQVVALTSGALLLPACLATHQVQFPAS